MAVEEKCVGRKKLLSAKYEDVVDPSMRSESEAESQAHRRSSLHNDLTHDQIAVVDQRLFLRLGSLLMVLGGRITTGSAWCSSSWLLDDHLR